MRGFLCLCLVAGACGAGTDAAPACDTTGAVAGALCPRAVRGRVVDEVGAPLAALTVSVCADQCYYGTTLDDGAFAVTPAQAIVLAQYALEVHGRPDRATYYTPLPTATGDATHPTLAFAAPLPLPTLPPSGPAIVDDGSAQLVASGDLELSIASGTTILFSVEDFATPHGHELRVRAIDAPASLPFVDAADPPRALWATAPFEAAFSQPVAVSLANRPGLPAGSAVELLSLGGLVNGPPPAGRWRHAAAAHVSADGSRITTDPGEGIDELTWLAVREMK